MAQERQPLFSNHFFLARSRPDESAAHRDVMNGHLAGRLDVRETVAVKSRRDGREHNPRLGYVPDDNAEALYNVLTGDYPVTITAELPQGTVFHRYVPPTTTLNILVDVARGGVRADVNQARNELVNGGLLRGPGGMLKTSIISLVSHKENVLAHSRSDAIMLSPEPKIAVIVSNTGSRLGYIPHETAQLYAPFFQHPFIKQNCDIVVEFNAAVVNRFHVTIMGEEEDYHQVRRTLPHAEDWVDHTRAHADAGADMGENE